MTDAPLGEDEAPMVSESETSEVDPAPPVADAPPEPIADPPSEDDPVAESATDEAMDEGPIAPESYGASFSITPPPVPAEEEDIPPPPEAPEADAIAPSDAPADDEHEALDALAPTPEPEAETSEHETQDFGFVTDHYDEDEDEPRSRRGLIVVALLLLVGASAAAFYFFAPNSWKQQVGLAQVTTETPLELVLENYTREALPSGNQLLTLRGRVINPTDSEQDVPVLRAQLRDENGTVVHAWTIQPPKNSLDAGESASFNNVQTDVPPGGDDLVVTLDAPDA